MFICSTAVVHLTHNTRTQRGEEVKVCSPESNSFKSCSMFWPSKRCKSAAGCRSTMAVAAARDMP